MIVIIDFAKGRITMPHMVVEYTENIEGNLQVSELLKKMNESLISHEGLFSPQGIRSRAIKLTDYLIGDGTNSAAFVHVILKIAPGRSEEAKQNVFNHLFTTMDNYFKDTIDQKVTISLEFLELSTGGSMYHQK